MIRSSQNRFTKGESCLTNLKDFYDETTAWMMRREQWILPTFRKAFTVSHKIVVDKFRECALDDCQRTKNWLDIKFYSVQIIVTGSIWKPVTRGAPQGSILHPVLFKLLVICFHEGEDAFSAMMIQSCEEWPIPKSVVQPFRRTLTGWRNGQRKIP